MANIVVTTVDVNHIKVEFNDYYPTYYDVSTAFYRRSEIAQVEVKNGYVLVTMDNNVKWHVSDTQTTGCFIIDNIDGTTTWEDLTTLATQIAALIKV